MSSSGEIHLSVIRATRVEGRLLSGQAVSRTGWSGGPADRSQDNPAGRAGISGARPATLIVALHAGEVPVDLAGDVALEDAHDLGFGASFEDASFDVGAGARFGAHAGKHDAPQGVVGLPVAATVQPMADGLAG